MDDKTINILLLGESGIGKSTLINSVANYVKYPKFESAEKAKLKCLMPVKFPVTTAAMKQVFVTVNCNEKEQVNNVVNTFTKAPQEYLVKLKEGTTVRFIDTPGIGNEDGATHDTANVKAIMEFLGQFKYLHGICIFQRPNVSVISPFFQFCVDQVLLQFGRSDVFRNILFVFTTTRVTDYRALDTLSNLKKIIPQLEDELKVHIPLNYNKTASNNVFCLDNEGFKYLTARQQDIHFGDPEVMAESWDISAESFFKIIDYIAALTPYQLSKVGVDEKVSKKQEEVAKEEGIPIGPEAKPIPLPWQSGPLFSEVVKRSSDAMVACNQEVGRWPSHPMPQQQQQPQQQQALVSVVVHYEDLEAKINIIKQLLDEPNFDDAHSYILKLKLIKDCEQLRKENKVPLDSVEDMAAKVGRDLNHWKSQTIPEVSNQTKEITRGLSHTSQPTRVYTNNARRDSRNNSQNSQYQIVNERKGSQTGKESGYVKSEVKKLESRNKRHEGSENKLNQQKFWRY